MYQWKPQPPQQRKPQPPHPNRRPPQPKQEGTIHTIDRMPRDHETDHPHTDKGTAHNHQTMIEDRHINHEHQTEKADTHNEGDPPARAEHTVTKTIKDPLKDNKAETIEIERQIEEIEIETQKGAQVETRHIATGTGARKGRPEGGDAAHPTTTLWMTSWN